MSDNTRRNIMNERLSRYDEPQRMGALGIYPYFRPIEAEQDTKVVVIGKKVLVFGSNSYLGLTSHPKVKEASKKTVDKYGSCAGYRFLNETLDIHIELEEKLARFVGKEEALVYSTGFQANLGAIPTVVGKNDYILLDEFNHASIIEGVRLSFTKTVKFRHNNMNSLKKLLQHCEPEAVKLIVVDGIFNMEGDIANLPEIARLSEKYNTNIMVDDAHSLGVIGEKGSGVSSHFGLTKQIDIIMGTFSKLLATIGRFLAADKVTISFLKHHSRALIFSTSASPSATASALAAPEIMQNEPERIEQPWKNMHFCHIAFTDAGFYTGLSCTSLNPITVRDSSLKTYQWTKILMNEGIFVNPVVSPAVPNTSTLIRFSLMATHTQTQLNKAVYKITTTARKLEII